MDDSSRPSLLVIDDEVGFAEAATGALPAALSADPLERYADHADG
jgi:hypothetical protein